MVVRVAKVGRVLVPRHRPGFHPEFHSSRLQGLVGRLRVIDRKDDFGSALVSLPQALDLTQGERVNPS